MNWIKVDKFGSFVSLEFPFLIFNEYGGINLGYNSFDYYDSEYWCPIPFFAEFKNSKITNDEFIEKI